MVGLRLFIFQTLERLKNYIRKEKKMKKFLLVFVSLIFLMARGGNAQILDEKVPQMEDLLNKVQQELKDLKEEQKKQAEKVQETDVVKEEIRKLRLEVAIPEIEYRSYAGLGPAASKIYYTPRGAFRRGARETDHPKKSLCTQKTE